jgi:hypothetical protein
MSYVRFPGRNHPQETGGATVRSNSEAYPFEYLEVSNA